MPKGRRFFYNLSAAGWTLLDSLLLTYYVIFLLPPSERISIGMIQYVPDTLFLWGLTALGVIMLFGRLVDAIADPFVASWSDRCRSSFGKRRLFLALGGIPLAFSAVAVFFPPHAGPTWGNTAYLALMFGVYFFCFTLYVGPYLALIPELGHTENERLSMTTAQGYWSLAGSAAVMIGGPLLIALLMRTLPATSAYQTGIVLMAIPGLLLCYSAVFAVDEKRYSKTKPSTLPLKESFIRTVSNRNFLIYLIGNMALWFHFNIIRSTSISMAIILGRGGEAFASVLFMVLIGVAAVCFPLAAYLARKFSKKTLMLAALLGFALSGILLSLTGIIPINPKTWMIIAILSAAFPAAVIIIIPNVMLSEISQDDYHKHGEQRSGMFFGVQGFFMKLNIGLSGAVIAGLYSAFGYDIAKPMGVRLTPLAGTIVALIGFAVMLSYREPKTTI